jgi:hypothetical protein
VGNKILAKRGQTCKAQAGFLKFITSPQFRDEKQVKGFDVYQAIDQVQNYNIGK